MTTPGKYDALCTYVRESAKARGAVVLVVVDDKGDGLGVQGVLSVQGDAIMQAALPGMLRKMADQIERDPYAVAAQWGNATPGDAS